MGQAAGLAVPADNATFDVWTKLFDKKGEWDHLVRIFFSWDKSCRDGSDGGGSTNTFAWLKCPLSKDGTRPCWNTRTALESHMRAKHKDLSVFRYYVNSDGKCLICQTVFHSWIRWL